MLNLEKPIDLVERNRREEIFLKTKKPLGYLRENPLSMDVKPIFWADIPESERRRFIASGGFLGDGKYTNSHPILNKDEYAEFLFPNQKWTHYCRAIKNNKIVEYGTFGSFGGVVIQPGHGKENKL